MSPSINPKVHVQLSKGPQRGKHRTLASHCTEKLKSKVWSHVPCLATIRASPRKSLHGSISFRVPDIDAHRDIQKRRAATTL